MKKIEPYIPWAIIAVIVIVAIIAGAPAIAAQSVGFKLLAVAGLGLSGFSAYKITKFNSAKNEAQTHPISDDKATLYYFGVGIGVLIALLSIFVF